jgi:uncharacterized protein (DUF1330 family)
MAAYLIADISVHDAASYKRYVDNVPQLIVKHGGAYRVRGGESVCLEGDWRPPRLIVVEFLDREAALAFYNDPAYEPYKALRQSSARGNVLVVEGIE